MQETVTRAGPAMAASYTLVGGIIGLGGLGYVIDQWRRIGVTATHEQLETTPYQAALTAGNFEVAIEFISDYTDDPTAHFTKFLTKKLSAVAHSNHDDAKIDAMYEAQRRAVDPVERKRIVNELDKYAITTANVVPFLWFQRIVVMPKKVRGWYAMPSHYLGQDLSDVWLAPTSAPLLGLGLIPQHVHLVEIGLRRCLALRRQQRLNAVKAAGELVVRLPQRLLGIDVEVAGDVPSRTAGRRLLGHVRLVA
jgi:hypothetical protein